MASKKLEKGTLGRSFADPSLLRDRSPILKDSCWEWQPQCDIQTGGPLQTCPSINVLSILTDEGATPILKVSQQAWPFTCFMLAWASSENHGVFWSKPHSPEHLMPGNAAQCSFGFGFVVLEFGSGAVTTVTKHFVTEWCSQHLLYILLRNMVSSSYPSLAFNSLCSRLALCVPFSCLSILSGYAYSSVPLSVAT